MGFFDRALNFNQPAVRGPGDYVADRYNQMLGGTAKGLWHKFVNISGGGFAKGVLAAAVVFVGVMALAGGAMGAAGMLTVGGLVMPTFEAGMAAGISKGIGILAGTSVGWGTLLAGGVIGSVFEKKKVENGGLSVEEAQQRARQYELMRQQAQEQRLQPAMPKEQENTPPAADQGMNAEAPGKNFCACVDAQRTQQKQRLQEPRTYER